MTTPSAADPRPTPSGSTWTPPRDALAPDWDDQATVLAGMPGAALHERIGLQVTEARPERVVGTLPVEGNTQPFGLLHGGATAVLVEALGSYAATLHGLPESVALGIEINVTHHRAARSGIVTGVATPVHRGRQLATYEVAVTDEAGRRVATGRLTCLLQSVDLGR